ncbi:MAG: hypothetical protein PHT02_07055 [Tissierellia bacterium]|nr:hypothetical protein [Tissierellia bacterium]
MGKTNDLWQPCPRCGSKKVTSMGRGFFFLLGLILTSISIWLLIIPPVGIVGIIAGVVFMAISPFMKGILQCKDCKKSWKYKEGIESELNSIN